MSCWARAKSRRSRCGGLQTWSPKGTLNGVGASKSTESGGCREPGRWVARRCTVDSRSRPVLGRRGKTRNDLKIANADPGAHRLLSAGFGHTSTLMQSSLFSSTFTKATTSRRARLLEGGDRTSGRQISPHLHQATRHWTSQEPSRAWHLHRRGPTTR